MRLVKSLHQSYKFTIVFVLHLPTICRYSTFAASRSSSVGAVLLFVYSIVFIILLTSFLNAEKYGQEVEKRRSFVDTTIHPHGVRFGDAYRYRKKSKGK